MQRSSDSLLVGVALAGLGAQFVGGGEDKPSAAAPGARPVVASAVRPLPVEIRGVHVTMGLASLPGKLEEYVSLEDEGLTAIELDVKDEDGQVGFAAGSLRLANAVGATRSYYKPREAAKLVHDEGLYLIGRVVVFEDPVLAHARPDLAVRRSDGSVWEDAAGLAWTNPYDKRVWDYNIAIAAAAAKSGFDEIMFDYVRFPSDGDVQSAVYGKRAGRAKNDAVPAFLAYASKKLEPLGVRVSAALFGLSASRDMGIGQIPRKISKHVHAIYAMTYPSLFGAGELGLADPSAARPGPRSRGRSGASIARSRDGARMLVPWVQDFSFSTPYGKDEVRAQIYAARIAGAKGYLLWNAQGVYTPGTLTAP